MRQLLLQMFKFEVWAPNFILENISIIVCLFNLRATTYLVDWKYFLKQKAIKKINLNERRL